MNFIMMGFVGQLVVNLVKEFTMGMYTELIVGCTLEKSLPEVCAKALTLVSNKKVLDKADKETKEFIKEYDLYSICWSESAYFGAPPYCVFRGLKDNCGNHYSLSIRANLKNYKGEIEKFLNYIKPYVKWGSGTRELYAMTIYEEDKEPTFWFKYN